MYVVRAGRLEAVDEAVGAVIGDFRRGDALGEFAPLTGSPRSASVRATRATEVIAVCRADFSALLHGSPALSLALNRSLGGVRLHVFRAVWALQVVSSLCSPNSSCAWRPASPIARSACWPAG